MVSRYNNIFLKKQEVFFANKVVHEFSQVVIHMVCRQGQKLHPWFQPQQNFALRTNCF
jgi:hypothetical protein